MVWHRLPTFLPNVPMRLIPFNKAQKEAYEATGFVRTVAFRTLPSLGKVHAPLTTCALDPCAHFLSD